MLSVGQVLRQASSYIEAGNHPNALLMLEQAVRQVPSLAALHYNLGVAQDLSGRPEEALRSLQKAVQAEPANPHFRLGLAQLIRNTSHAEAVPHFQAAIALGANEPQAFWMLAAILLDQNKPDEALSVCAHGLKTWSDHFDLLAAQTIACLKLGLYAQAVASGLKQCALRPVDVQVWTNIGIALRALGRLDDSASALRQACQLGPVNATTHFQLALTLLLAENYQEGFEEYEWRSQIVRLSNVRRDFPQPTWDGRELAGKRIFLWTEQGAGDFIQFTRYLALAQNRGGHVILETPPTLLKLARRFPGNPQTVSTGTQVDFDVHCSLMSLPRICQQDLTSIPPALSWSVPEELTRQWAERLGPRTQKRVALVWAGNPDHSENLHRSINLKLFLELFAPLFDVPSLSFFSLQVGAPGGELEGVGFGQRLQNLAPFCTDYCETAAALTQMDLLISVDTSVAHLAGSLAVPTWLLLPYAPDWRWLLDRDNTVWYPAMRLFRQKQPRDWQTVIDSVARELNSMVTL